MADLPQVQPLTRAEWRQWLEENHAVSGSVWFVYSRKGGGAPGFPLAEAIEEALCFGWIDSLPRTLDAARSMVRMSPRKPRSGWSAINKERIERMNASGLMRPAGAAAIAAAKADGSWQALDGPAAGTIPPDLDLAFQRHPGAAGNFAAFPASTRRAILEWIGAAKTPGTRSRRVEETASLAARNERANQWRPPGGRK